MADNLGKKFEQKVKEDWNKSFPNGLLIRLPDQQSMYYGSTNICDYLGFNKNTLFLLEVKSVQKPSFPFANLPQYERLKNYINIEGVRAGVIIWFTLTDNVIYVPISTVKKLKLNNIKSINYNKIDREKYFIMDIPSRKLVTFMESDYKCLMNIPEDKDINKEVI